jgi:hypothetical protein
MEFFDEATEQQCYGYVATNPEPIRTLHGAMNLKVEPALLRVLGGDNQGENGHSQKSSSIVLGNIEPSHAGVWRAMRKLGL